MAIWHLEAAGLSPALIEALAQGQLTEPLRLTYTIPLVTRRVKAALYDLMRKRKPGAFKISQLDPCTLILKPTAGQRR